jgi:tripartite ATP-independent transporter DctM subunit
VYCYIYSRVKKIRPLPKVSWAKRTEAAKDSLPVMGFPVIILGGIYGGYFSPTEAASVAVFYALILETIVYKSLTFKKIVDAFLQTGVICGVVLILVGAGQAFSWMISFMQIPQQLVPHLFGADPSMLRVIIIINAVYFVGCMFTSPLVLIYILSPIFQPYVVSSGIDPIFMGTLVVLQAAIGAATPPFGADIFTAQLLFRRPYLEVIGHAYPFILIQLLAAIILIVFPDIALFLPNLALGG